jgi:uncharacterized membrane protein YqiK
MSFLIGFMIIVVIFGGLVLWFVYKKAPAVLPAPVKEAVADTEQFFKDVKADAKKDFAKKP